MSYDPYKIIKTIHLSEKSESLKEDFNQYTFRVDKKATKPQIAKAIKDLFNVTPIAVSTQNYRGKKKRQGTKFAGRTAHWKKAIVTLKLEDVIDFA